MNAPGSLHDRAALVVRRRMLMRMILLTCVLFAPRMQGGELFDEMWRKDLGATTAELISAKGKPDASGTLEDHEIISCMVFRLGDKPTRSATEAALHGIWCLDGMIHANGWSDSCYELLATADRPVLLAMAMESALPLTGQWLLDAFAIIPPLPAGPATESSAERHDRMMAQMAAVDAQRFEALEKRWVDRREDGFDERLLVWVSRHVADFVLPAVARPH